MAARGIRVNHDGGSSKLGAISRVDSTLWPLTQSFTICGWMRIKGTSSGSDPKRHVPFALNHTSTTILACDFFDYVEWGTVTNGSHPGDPSDLHEIKLASPLPGFGVLTDDFNPSPPESIDVDEDWFYAFTWDAVQSYGDFYYGKDASGQLTHRPTLKPSGNWNPLHQLINVAMVGWDGETNHGSNAEYTNFKIWTRALSSSELLLEKQSASPVSSTSLWAYWRLNSTLDLSDGSGNGHTPSLTNQGGATSNGSMDPHDLLPTMVGTASGSATVTGDLHGTGAMDGVSLPFGSFASLSVLANIGGTSAGAATVIGDLRGFGHMVGESDATSSVFLFFSGQQDSEGWTLFPLAVGARQIFVAKNGSDDNDGLAGTTGGGHGPKLTLLAGYQAIRPGVGDQLLLKRGDAWQNESFSGQALNDNGWQKCGLDVSWRTIIGAYGPTALPRPVIRTGTGNGIVSDFQTSRFANILGVSNTSPIVVTTQTALSDGIGGPNAPPLQLNDFVRIVGVKGCTAANGPWRVSPISPTQFRLQNSDGTASGAYVSGSGKAVKPLAFFGVIDVDMYADGHNPPDLSQPVGLYLNTPTESFICEGTSIRRFDKNVVLYDTGDTVNGRHNNLAFRRNNIWEAWRLADNGNVVSAMGFYAQSFDGMLFEDSFLDSNGWLPSDATTIPTPNYYRRNIYLQNGYTNLLMQNNMLSRTEGVQARSGGVMRNNLLLRMAIPLQCGSGNFARTLDPDGVVGFVQNNVALDGGNLDPSNPRGWAYICGNTSATRFINNIAAHNTSGLDPRPFVLLFDNGSGDPVGSRNDIWDGNIVYDWVNTVPGGESVLSFYRFADVVPPLVNLTFINNKLIVVGATSDANYLIDTIQGGAGVSVAQIHSANNTFWRNAVPGGGTHLFNDQFGPRTFQQFMLDINDTTSLNVQPAFPDPNRTIATYMASIGQTPATLDNYCVLTHDMRKGNWTTQLLPSTINDYVRQGFNLGDGTGLMFGSAVGAALATANAPLGSGALGGISRGSSSASLLTGALTPLVGVVNGVAAADGTLRGAGELDGASSGTSTAALSTGATLGLIRGSSSGASTAVGAVTGAGAIAGLVKGSSLALLATTIGDVIGSSVATSAAAAAIVGLGELDGVAIGGSSSALGLSLVGESDGLADAEAGLQGLVFATGSSAGQAVSGGALFTPSFLNADSEGFALAVGDLIGTPAGLIFGASIATSEADAFALGIAPIAGTSTAGAAATIDTSIGGDQQSALIVEDGTGLVDADAYDSIGEVQVYAARHGLAFSGPTAALDTAVRQATQYVEATYSQQWLGMPVWPLEGVRTQALSWPRYGVVDRDGRWVPSNVVPRRVKEAIAELAIKALAYDLLPDVEPGTNVASESVSVGPVSSSTTYVSGKDQTRVFRKVYLLLEPYLIGGDLIERG